MAITLIENFRAIFYAPFYAAFALEAFKTEGVEVVLQTSTAAEKTLVSLRTGTGQVTWGGPMRLLHAHDDNPASDVVSFCEVVGRDPFYLIGREPNPDFVMRDLIGRTLAAVSEVPTPWYCLQYDLRLAGVDLTQLRYPPPATMAQNMARLRAGEVDVVQVYEPFVQQALADGCGHVWYAAASRGLTSYTTLNTTRAFLEREPDTALAMTRAMQRVLRWMIAHDTGELAHLITPYFPDLPTAVLCTSLAGYRNSGIWNRNPLQQRAGLRWLRDAMLACGAIRRKPEYEALADMRFAEQVAQEIDIY